VAIKEKSGYLARYGEVLAENGYRVVPIEIGAKKPVFKQWNHLHANTSAVLDWVASGMGENGVGIITKYTPAIDIDVLDEDVAQKIQDWCHENLGPAPVRFGNKTKRLLLYRTDIPFTKQKSAVFEDEWKQRNHVEALGDGQQFVAYHIHPDTNMPYRWDTDETPENTPAKQLTLITVDQLEALMDFAESLFAEEEWVQVKKRQMGSGANPDDPFADVQSTVNIDEDELRRMLLIVPGAEDYERWYEIGMALFHQFDGQDTGFDMWKEWSATADNYDEKALRPKWKSFQVEGKAKSPITARSIIKLAREAEETAALVEVQMLRGAFRGATSEKEWNDACAKVRKSQIGSVARSELTELAKDRYKHITGGKISIGPLRQALAYDSSKEGMPGWCREWVYDTSDDRFVNRQSKITLTMQGFNAANSRLALSKKDILDGRTQPAAPASDLALNIYRIPVVNGRMFAPGEDIIFDDGGRTWINTYRNDLAPDIPVKLGKRDRRNINLVDNHIRHLLPNEQEYGYLKHWLAFIVQNPGELTRWAVMLQGTEGDGKSFFMFLLKAVLGSTNVKPVNASTLESNFTDWAHGAQVIFIEEARMLGHGSADVLNKIKPNITNKEIEIHPKGKPPVGVRNTANYFITSNFKNAMPIGDNDRRYGVFFSQWQSKEQLTAFKAQHPTYYRELYDTLVQSPGALRKWLLQMDIPQDFIEMGEAPITKAHKIMSNAATPQFIRDMRQMIEERLSPLITTDLISMTELTELLGESGADIPESKTLSRVMEINGYTSLGRYMIGESRHRFWSSRPEKFPSLTEVRKHVADAAENRPADAAPIEKVFKRRQPDPDLPFEDLDAEDDEL